MPVYLDCNATTPIAPQVEALVLKYMREEFGNAGSRSHDFGLRARQAVQTARDRVGRVVAAQRDEVIFTSGATESNNLAILGLATEGENTGRKHIVSTQIEHKAVLEPLQHLESRGFEVTLVKPERGGWVDSGRMAEAVRDDTLLVSLMHVNNETGIVQPLDRLAEALKDHPAYLHSDAAQGFGKSLNALRNPRIDLIGISGHKIYAPKGVGALITRRRGYLRPPLSPLFYGGGQERGLRPGTHPVALIAGLGLAAELSVKELEQRQTACAAFRKNALKTLVERLGGCLNADPEKSLPHVLNLSIRGIDSEALMVALKDVVAISNGSACTSQSYAPSHVLEAMGLSQTRIEGALRISWCYLTEEVDWDRIAEVVEQMR